jgi:hypothetical protein
MTLGTAVDGPAKRAEVNQERTKMMRRWYFGRCEANKVGFLVTFLSILELKLPLLPVRHQEERSKFSMFMSRVTVLLLALSLSAAQNFSTWSPPGPGDVRSPCPGLNSLANHGFLPHNGRGLTVPILIKALNDGMNVGADFATVIGGAGLLSVPGNLLATSFDLDNLDEHNFPIEHDASLSRADYYENNRDNFSFNQTIFNTVLAYYDGMNETSIPVAAKAKLALVSTCKRDIAKECQVQSSHHREEERSKVHVYTTTIYPFLWGDCTIHFRDGRSYLWGCSN